MSSSENPDVQCPGCRTRNVWFAEVCTSCGTSLAGSSLEGSNPKGHPQAEGRLQDTETQCHDCGALNSGLAQFCTSCAASLAGGTSENNGPSGNLSTQDNEILCPNCKTVNVAFGRFCTSCGASITPTNILRDSTTSETDEGGTEQRDHAAQNPITAGYEMASQNSNNGESKLATAGFILGLVTFGIFIIALIPCLGCINYINFLIAASGVVVNIIVLAQGQGSNKNIIAIGLCAVAIVFGAIRLVLGMGFM